MISLATTRPSWESQIDSGRYDREETGHLDLGVAFVQSHSNWLVVWNIFYVPYMG